MDKISLDLGLSDVGGLRVMEWAWAGLNMNDSRTKMATADEEQRFEALLTSNISFKDQKSLHQTLLQNQPFHWLVSLIT